MQKMQCGICGHIYDPEKGDVGVEPGTPFDDVPGEWRCPICGAEKINFMPF